VSIVVGVCFVTCIGALASLYFRKDVVAIGTMVFVVGTLITCRIFGHVEFRLVIHRLTPRFRWRLDSQSESSKGGVQRSHQLYGSRNWGNLWAALTESAETFGLMRMEFRILIPSIHESFYAVWSKPNGATDEEQWSAKSPLFLDGQLAGSLVLAGHSRQSAIQAISAVADFLEPIEDQIRHVATGSRRLDSAAACSDQKQKRASAQEEELSMARMAHVTGSATDENRRTQTLAAKSLRKTLRIPA
jgi:hypothetical protein